MELTQGGGGKMGGANPGERGEMGGANPSPLGRISGAELCPVSVWVLLVVDKS